MRSMEAWGAAVLLDEGGGANPARYALDGEGLFRALVTMGCNPHPNLRDELRTPETHRFVATPPRQSTPAVTPAVGEEVTPAVDGSFSKPFQKHSLHNNPYLQLASTTPAVTPAVDGHFSVCDQTLNQKENASEYSLSPIYGTFARADLPSSLPSHSQTPSGSDPDAQPQASDAGPGVTVGKDAGENVVRAAPSRETAKVLAHLPLNENFTGEAQAERASPPAGEANPIAAGTTSHDLQTDADTLFSYLQAQGPATYGAAATGMAWGVTRIMLAEAALIVAGRISHDRLGKMVTRSVSPSGAIDGWA
ncbi:MAG: hypothetical protein U1E06_11285 [Tabrizicola sp.]|uniref:hypothetical protein n=1 Tax=Tabrizicola sp. TaxID=2005166 RepID=UPI002735DB97|nr:hypothetical protein [Tabrizicola sp.]MDP3264222.1 hypothetical protein [Tabrizicola sp.]MDZ4067410.1 hypothetical protein [Tabrizicola sp.]